MRVFACLPQPEELRKTSSASSEVSRWAQIDEKEAIRKMASRIG